MLLNEFLKEHQKVQRLEAALAAMGRTIENAGRENRKSERQSGTKPAPQTVLNNQQSRRSDWSCTARFGGALSRKNDLRCWTRIVATENVSWSRRGKADSVSGTGSGDSALAAKRLQFGLREKIFASAAVGSPYRRSCLD